MVGRNRGIDRGVTKGSHSVLYVGVVPPGDPERLRASVVLALRDEARPDSDLLYSNVQDRALLARLRSDLLREYAARDPRYHEQQLLTLTAFLQTGSASEAGRRAAIEKRVACRWVAEYLTFATDELETEAKRHRERTIIREAEATDREKRAEERAAEAVWFSFQIQCQQQCGRQSKGGSGGEGEGCPSCPRRWIPK